MVRPQGVRVCSCSLGKAVLGVFPIIARFSSFLFVLLASTRPLLENEGSLPWPLYETCLASG
jgi:hypothetical protein